MVRFMSPSSQSFKPAAIPLMEAGKALSMSGEMWIDWINSPAFVQSMTESSSSSSSADTHNKQSKSKSKINSNTAALLGCGVKLRSAGDAMAQAAASGRFAYGMEMTCNGLRESAAALQSATSLLQSAWQDAIGEEGEINDGDDDNDEANERRKQWINVMERTTTHLSTCSVALEAAGAGIMQRRPYSELGLRLMECGQALQQVATPWLEWMEPSASTATSSSISSSSSSSLVTAANSLGEQLAFAANSITEAGNNLQTTGTKSSTSQRRPW